MIKVYVLVVMMHVNSGGIINFQEFNSLAACQYAANLITTRSRQVTPSSNADAFCVTKH